jgi:hypothetical protein
MRVGRPGPMPQAGCGPGLAGSPFWLWKPEPRSLAFAFDFASHPDQLSIHAKRCQWGKSFPNPRLILGIWKNTE